MLLIRLCLGLKSSPEMFSTHYYPAHTLVRWCGKTFWISASVLSKLNCFGLTVCLFADCSPDTLCVFAVNMSHWLIKWHSCVSWSPPPLPSVLRRHLLILSLLPLYSLRPPGELIPCSLWRAVRDRIHTQNALTIDMQLTFRVAIKVSSKSLLKAQQQLTHCFF